MQASNAPENIDNDAKLAWMRQYQTQKRLCDEANGVLRSIIKRAKSEGMNSKSLIGAVASSKLDPDVVKNDLRDTIHYLSLLRMPLTQAELFADLDVTVSEDTAAASSAWDADDAGYRAGRAGAGIDDCPFPHGTELAVHWVKSWQAGLATIAQEMGPNQRPASVSKGRPRRAAQPSLDVGAPVEASTRVDAPLKRITKSSRKAGNGNGSGRRPSVRKAVQETRPTH